MSAARQAVLPMLLPQPVAVESPSEFAGPLPTHRRGGRPQVVGTPPALLREIARRHGRGGLTLDAAATARNTVAPYFFSEGRSGLTHPWTHEAALITGPTRLDVLHRQIGLLKPKALRSRAWVNPPYEDILPWCVKAHAEVHAGNAEVCVMLLPARVGTDWWMFCEQHGARIEPIRGRVNFIPPPGVEYRGGFEWSCVVIWSLPIAAEDFR